MTMKLYSEESIQAIANKIREKDGNAALMTVAQMPSRIDKLLPEGSREVWLFANQDQTSLSIDTGVSCQFDDSIKVVGYGNIYSTSTLVAARVASDSRIGVNLLTTQNTIRAVWGNSGLQQANYETTTLSLWRPMQVTLDKTGMQIKGFKQSYAQADVITKTFNPAPTKYEITAYFEIFPNIAAGNTTTQPGVFRRFQVYQDGTLAHNFVPVLKSDYSLVLLDKVTQVEIAIPSGENGFGAKWDPQLDAKLNQTILSDGETPL